MCARAYLFHPARYIGVAAGAFLLVPLSVTGQSQQPTQARPQTPAQQTEEKTAQDKQRADDKQRDQSQTSQAQSPTKVDLSNFEENPRQYLNKRITFDGEVQSILGPRLFTVDERQWIDFDGETLVMVPPPMAALLRENAPVTVTGTVRPFVRAEIEREWGWFDLDPQIEVTLKNRPVIVADTVMSDGRNMAMRLSIDRAAGAKPDTSGTPAAAGASSRDTPITDLSMVMASNDERLVGRHVHLKNVQVSTVAKQGGFWIAAGNEHLFVLPAEKKQVRRGQRLDIMGYVAELPDGMKDRLDADVGRDEDIYVYASDVSPTE